MYTYNYSQASYEFTNYFNDNENFDDFIRNLTLGNSISLANTEQKYYILPYAIFPTARLTFQGENLLNEGSEGTVINLGGDGNTLTLVGVNKDDLTTDHIVVVDVL